MISIGGMAAKKPENDDEQTASFAEKISEAAFCVHSELGPGLGESVYYECFERELKHMKMNVESGVPFSIRYRKKNIKNAFIADFIIENTALVFIRAEEKSAMHEMEIRSYLKHSGLTEAYILNFRVSDMRDGIIKASFRPGWVDARKSAN